MFLRACESFEGMVSSSNYRDVGVVASRKLPKAPRLTSVTAPEHLYPVLHLGRTQSFYSSTFRTKSLYQKQFACSAMPTDEEYSNRWIKIWSDGLPPGQAFDASKSAPSLVNLLASGHFDVNGKRALVPGCGRGYDVVLLAQNGASPAIGLELSSHAVKAAEEYRSKSGVTKDIAAEALFKQGDFFNFDDGLFDVGYDYTFLCAMRPDMRGRWAEAWGRQIKPGGQLVTLMFPVDASRARDEGPPFPLTPELYNDLLLPLGFKRTFFEQVQEEDSNEGRKGMEFMAIWTKA